MVELTILTLLVIKHFIADMPLQTLAMVHGKAVLGNLMGIFHSVIHAILTFVVFALFISTGYAFLVAVSDGIIHYVIDYTKVNLDKYFNASRLQLDDQGRTVGQLITSKVYYYLFVGDQCLHFLTYIGLVALTLL